MNITQIRKSIIVAAASVAVALAAIGSAAASDLKDRVASDGLNVAFYNFKPFTYMDDNNELVGTDIELLKEVIAAMGGKIGNAQAIDWGALIPGVKSGRFDVVAAGMFVTPKRCAAVRFSQPYFGIKNAFTVLKGNPDGISDYESIRDKGLKVGVVSGAAQVGHSKLAGIADENIVQLPDNPAGIAALRAGRINAWSVSSVGARDLVQNVPEQDLDSTPVFEKIGGQSVVSHGAFAFRPDDGDFVDEFDKALVAFVGSPEHVAIMEKHGMSADELPVAKTEELCAG